MNGKKINNWTKSNLLKFLAGKSRFNDGKHAIETFVEEDSSMSVTIKTEDQSPIAIEMNGKEVEAEIILFTLK